MKEVNQSVSNVQVLPEKRKGKKVLLAIFIMLLSCVLLFGSLFAFFSDKLSGEGTVVAGTLQIEEFTPDSNGYTLTRWEVGAGGVGGEWKTFDPDNDILNPGDYIQISADLKNVGEKSFWLLPKIDFDFTSADAEMKKMTFYKGAVDYGDTGTVATTTGTDVITYEPKDDLVIMNGEKEEEDGGITYGQAYDDVILTVVFDKTAGNAAQAQSMKIDVLMKALQYRNNLTPSVDDWNSIVK